MKGLVILDRDGVINQDSENYIKSEKEWHPIKGSIEAIAQLTSHGYTVVIATNQSGIARGYFSLEQLAAMHNKLERLVKKAGGYISGIYYCPHGPDDNCLCRKPKTGLIDMIFMDYKSSNTNVWLVGDSLSDLEAGMKSGCQVSLVLTGKGLKTRANLKENKKNTHTIKNVPIYKDLNSFTQNLLLQEVKCYR